MVKEVARMSARGRIRWIAAALLAVVLMAVAAPAEATARSGNLGNDVSWPQCGKALPSGQAFAIVGVNGGLANNTNRCLSTELSWAGVSAGGTAQQPDVALYVNTANPGTAGSWWPNSNVYAGSTIFNPYGTCDGSVAAACSYMYGYAKAYDDANIRGVSHPSDDTWWLDVETGNTWSADKAANRADLEGMTAYFHSIGADVGIYSTSNQWTQVAGTVPGSSNLYNLDTWLAGAKSLTSAKRNCDAPALTGGGTVSLTQFVSGGLDYDVSCI